MCVKDLDLFVTVQLFEDTPPVLSLGQLCEDHGYSSDCTGGPKPTSENTMQYEEDIEFKDTMTNARQKSVASLVQATAFAGKHSGPHVPLLLDG